MSLLGMNTRAAAEFLGVSIGTLRRWADSGAVKCSRTPGGQRRFTEEQLREFAASLAEDQP